MENITEKSCCVFGNILDRKLQKKYIEYMERELILLILEGFTQFTSYYGSEFNHKIIKILDKIRKTSLNVEIHIELVVINLYSIVTSNEKTKKEYTEMVGLCDKITIINTVHSQQNRPNFYEYLVKKCGFLLYIGDISFRGNTIIKNTIKTFKYNFLPMKIIDASLISEELKLRITEDKRTENDFKEIVKYLIDGLADIKQGIETDNRIYIKKGLKSQEKLDEELMKYIFMGTKSVTLLNNDSEPMDMEKLEFLRDKLNKQDKELIPFA